MPGLVGALLDGGGGSGEGCREAELWWDVDRARIGRGGGSARGMAGGDSCGRSQAFQPEHWPEPSLQPAMIGFDPVVAVPLGDMRRGWTSSASTRTYGPALSVLTSTSAGRAPRPG